MEITLGLRVVRGSDWTWGDQDGGEGCVGTVAEVHTDETTDVGASTPRTVTVQWDCGNRCRYRCGIGGKYDLRIFDSAPTGLAHPAVDCGGCGQGIEVMDGMRWKCAKCFDYDLCTPCYMEGKHSLEHAFIRYDTRTTRTRVSPRETAEKLEAKGIFPGAEVVKGYDWCWEGSVGEQGKVTDVQEWSEEDCSVQFCRSAVSVEWTTSHQDTCRIGFKGKVDLKCITPSSGGVYYPNHLPHVGAPPMPTDSQEILVGDYVRVELDTEIFMLMQEGHGGWNMFMDQIRGKVGVVHHILDSGDLSVLYRVKEWIINPDAAVKVDIPHYAADDVVRILDDMAEVRKLQQEHDNWNEEMSAIVGQVGTVRGVLHSGDVAVTVKGQMYEVNPLCLALAPDAKPPEIASTDALGLRQRMLTLREEENSEFMLYATVLGDVPAITEYLHKYPNEVNVKFNGMAAIHKAAMAGKIPVLKILVELGADIELEDGFGQRSLHHCAARNQAEAAKFFLGVNADVNAATTTNKSTPVIIAVAKGNKRVLDVLVSHPNVDLTLQDSDGDTALHYAVLKRKQLSVTTLLDVGADPTLINFKLSTPLQLAAERGFLPALEDCLKRFPQLVNQKNDDGLTLLHLAALNNHKDIAIFLLKQELCDIDALTQESHTPLHLAVLKGHTRIVEVLVGYGASLNVADSDGDTPLHSLFMDTEMVAPSSETPEIKRVQESLEEHVGSNSTNCVVACFLVREGADTQIKNKNDNPPLQLFPPDVSEVVSNFMKRNGSHKLFHGSLCASSSSSTESCDHTQQSTEPQVESTSPVAIVGDGKTAQEPVTSGITQPVTDNDISPSDVPLTSHCTMNGGQMTTLETASDTNYTPTIQTTTEAVVIPEEQLCLLCDNPIAVKFEPCGHAVLCEICSERAKKCPKCKSPVRALQRLTS